MSIVDPNVNFFKLVVKAIDPKVSEKALEFLASTLVKKEFKKKEIVLDSFKVHNEIGFVVDGIVRGFYINNKGDEITARFISKGGFVTEYSAFLNQKKSDYTFQCIEASTLLSFNYQHINNAYKKYPELERFGRLVAESIIKTLENRMRSFHFLDAEQRYLQFQERQDKLVDKISIKHLSTYLGVTRPSLSRIRKNLTSGSKR